MISFMGCSKDNRLAWFALSALVGALAVSLGIVIFPAEAHGAKLVFSAKFKCTQNPGSSNFNQANVFIPVIGGDVGTGPVFGANFLLQSIVNVHNLTENDVEFNKKAVIAVRQHQGGPGSAQVSGQVGETLRPNEALGIDCEDIHNLFTDSGIFPNNFTHQGIYEGFVVIETQRKRRLIVCANYFAATTTGSQGIVFDPSVSSDVQCFPEQRTSGKFVKQ